MTDHEILKKLGEVRAAFVEDLRAAEKQVERATYVEVFHAVKEESEDFSFLQSARSLFFNLDGIQNDVEVLATNLDSYIQLTRTFIGGTYTPRTEAGQRLLADSNQLIDLLESFHVHRG